VVVQLQRQVLNERGSFFERQQKQSMQTTA
jgi:hypothetical protein